MLVAYVYTAYVSVAKGDCHSQTYNNPEQGPGTPEADAHSKPNNFNFKTPLANSSIFWKGLPKEISQ